MFAKVAERITDILEQNKTIQGENREIYCYGIQQGFVVLLNIATTLLIGMICHMLWQSIVFTAAYIPLRSFAGGYHAKTPNRCYVSSIVLMFAVLLAMKYTSLTNFICSIIVLISSVLIVLLAPVENRNKPLDHTEQRVYRNRTLVIWASELIVTIVCFILHMMPLAVCMTFALAVMAVMLILGKLIQ